MDLRVTVPSFGVFERGGGAGPKPRHSGSVVRQHRPDRGEDPERESGADDAGEVGLSGSRPPAGAGTDHEQHESEDEEYEWHAAPY